MTLICKLTIDQYWSLQLSTDNDCLPSWQSPWRRIMVFLYDIMSSPVIVKIVRNGWWYEGSPVTVQNTHLDCMKIKTKWSTAPTCQQRCTWPTTTHHGEQFVASVTAIEYVADTGELSLHNNNKYFYNTLSHVHYNNNNKVCRKRENENMRVA